MGSDRNRWHKFPKKMSKVKAFKVFDKKFKQNKSKYIIQCCLAGLSIFIILLIYSTIYDLVVIASLGSTCFTVFLLPHTASSQPRTLIGSYAIGITAGSLFGIIAGLKYSHNIQLFGDYAMMSFAAPAVGLAMFLMVITNTEHPPAAGLAFDQFIVAHVFMIMLGVLTLVFIRLLLKNYLINLR